MQIKMPFKMPPTKNISFEGRYFVGVADNTAPPIDGVLESRPKQNQLCAILEDVQDPVGQTKYLLQNMSDEPIKLNKGNIPPQANAQVHEGDVVKITKYQIPASMLIEGLIQKNNAFTDRQKNIKIGQGDINDCYFLSALNALHRLQPGNLSKFVAEKPNGIYQVILGNQTFTVSLKEVVKQYNHSLIPVSSNNELVSIIENAFAQYLFKNYNETTNEIILTDKNNKKHKLKFSKPNDNATSNNTAKAYYLLDKPNHAGYVFAFLNNISFRHVKNYRFIDIQNLNAYLNKKNVVTFFDINKNNGSALHNTVEKRQLDFFKLNKHHSYQVVPMDGTNEADQNLLREYNAKLVAKNLPPIDNFNNLYRFINPSNTASYNPDEEASSKIFNMTYLEQALAASKITIIQVPTKEPATFCEVFQNLFKKQQPKMSTEEKETNTANKKPLDMMT